MMLSSQICVRISAICSGLPLIMPDCIMCGAVSTFKRTRLNNPAWPFFYLTGIDENRYWLPTKHTIKKKSTHNDPF
jgi:hypothetical protein